MSEMTEAGYADATDWKTRLPDIYQMFVSDEDGRYAIDSPWRDGDEVAATDGQICIRGPWKAEYGEMPPDEAIRPPYRKLVWDRSSYAERPLPLVNFADCELVKEEICTECKSKGTVICDYGHEDECRDCEGIGKVDSFLVLQWSEVVSANASWVDRLQKEGARLYPRKENAEKKGILALWDDYQALIMPIKVGDENTHVMKVYCLPVEPTDG